MAFTGFAAQRNANSRSVTYDITMWTDMTQEEYKSYQTNGKVGGVSAQIT